jgi:cation transport regulator ChaB
MQTKEQEREKLKADLTKATLIKAATDMMFNMQSGTILIPSKYKDQVLVTKDILKNDISGLVNSVLDFAITCGCVNFSVETNNQQLTELFNYWLSNINDDLRGQIPTGLKALQKEYLRERWKGSSFLLLRSIWEERDGFILPTKLWFVNGEDIVIDDKSDTSVIGAEKYFLQIDKRNQRPLPHSKEEKIFIQKPYESWGTSYPTPFLIRRGIYKNLKMLDALVTKGEFVITKALEYILLLKKGTEQLALANQVDFTYSSDELKQIKEKLEEVLADRRLTQGVPTYTSNFDTDMQHLIPEYEKALKQELYSPIERRLLGGLGLVDVLQGVSSTRRESTLNPRPFISEVESGINDFKMILADILETIILLNRVKHPKYIGSIRKIHNTPISQFITDDIRNHFRSMYDKGVISKQTYIEVVGECDIVVEYNRRKGEHNKDFEETFYPPITVNHEQHQNVDETPEVDKNNNLIPDDKKGEEKKNYNASIPTLYKAITDLPEEVKNSLPVSAQNLWMKLYNDNSSDGCEFSSKVAWGVIKKLYKKIDNSWVLKSYVKSSAGRLELSEDTMDSSKLDMELKRMQVEIARKILKEE